MYRPAALLPWALRAFAIAVAMVSDLSAAVSPSATSTRGDGSSEVRGPYFGQGSPGRIPQKFAPGVLSLPDRLEARIAFSPDGNECFFTVPDDFSFSNVRMYHTRCVNGVWSPQTVADFLRPGHNCVQPFFSADGERLYFTSAENGQNDIWVVRRTTTGWGPAQSLPTVVNSPAGEGEYSQTAQGDSYFESGRPGTAGGCTLWRVRGSTGAEYLGPALGSGTYDADPFIARDGRYLLFASYRPGGRGKADLYVTSLRGDHEWAPPINLNEYCPGINTAAIEYAPSLSGDGRFLFFVRLDPDSQQCDIWWVDNPIPASTASRETARAVDP